jgi:hypothetical protein
LKLLNENLQTPTATKVIDALKTGSCVPFIKMLDSSEDHTVSYDVYNVLVAESSGIPTLTVREAFRQFQNKVSPD